LHGAHAQQKTCRCTLARFASRQPPADICHMAAALHLTPPTLEAVQRAGRLSQLCTDQDLGSPSLPQRQWRAVRRLAKLDQSLGEHIASLQAALGLNQHPGPHEQQHTLPGGAGRQESFSSSPHAPGMAAHDQATAEVPSAAAIVAGAEGRGNGEQPLATAAARAGESAPAAAVEPGQIPGEAAGAATEAGALSSNPAIAAPCAAAPNGIDIAQHRGASALQHSRLWHSSIVTPAASTSRTSTLVVPTQRHLAAVAAPGQSHIQLALGGVSGVQLCAGHAELSESVQDLVAELALWDVLLGKAG